jgi:SAM-dependent methyltransferase
LFKNGAYQDIQGKYDLIVSFGVIEHVTSPTDFLQTLKQALQPDGMILLGQPIQNSQSYDVFFIDHLHHFFLSHLDAYFVKTGFKEVERSVGYNPMTNFSIHLLTPVSEAVSLPGYDPIEWRLASFIEEFQALNHFLQEHSGKTIYAYGASECLKLYEANTKLQDYITGIVDDFQPAALKLNDLEQIHPLETVFVLTMNPAYQDKVFRQIKDKFPSALIYSVQRKCVL